MASKSNKIVKTYRLSPIYLELLDTMLEALKEEEIKTNKTIILEKAIYHFAREVVLGREAVSDIVDKHLNAMLQNRGE